MKNMCDTSKRLGKHIRSLRQGRSLSLERLAERAGISSKYLGEVERGAGNISFRNLNRVAEALGVQLSDIVDAGHEREREELLKIIAEISQKLTDRDVQIIYYLVKMMAGK